jgi:two-component system phosphate regulon response regulator PhoB
MSLLLKNKNMNKEIDSLILLVEDEKILVNTLREKLSSEGFKVITATDGDQALSLAIEEHPDLILLDLLLPKVDGLTMLKKLRQDPWGKHAKVIILTNVSNSAKIADSMEIGLDNTFEYLVKTGWSLDNIVSRIKDKLKITSPLNK